MLNFAYFLFYVFLRFLISRKCDNFSRYKILRNCSPILRNLIKILLIAHNPITVDTIFKGEQISFSVKFHHRRKVSSHCVAISEVKNFKKILRVNYFAELLIQKPLTN